MPNTPLTIIYESFAQTFFLPLGVNVTFEAMYWFGKAGVAEAVFMAVGAVIGCMANWGFGLALAELRKKRERFFPRERYVRLQHFAVRYGVWLVALYWIPLGTLLVVTAGFFLVRWWHVLALAVLGSALDIYLHFPAVLA